MTGKLQLTIYRALIGGLIVLIGCNPSELEIFEDNEQEIINEALSNDLPKLSSWVIKDGQIIWQLNFDRDQPDLTNPDGSNAIFDMASVSKLIAVTAIMQLEEQGLIDLNADVNDYLPFEVRNPHYPDQSIKVYHLLTHSSGLEWPFSDRVVPRIYDAFPLDESPSLGIWLPQFIIPGGEYYVNNVWLEYPPGERETYSNIGVCLLAYLVEEVSQMSYSQYCREHIFLPLSMESTSFDFADLNLDLMVMPIGDQKQELGFTRDRMYPSSGFKTSPADFSHFVLAYMQGGVYNNQRILGEATVSRILEIQNPASGRCLIWMCSAGEWYGHDGGEPGVSARVEFQPSTGTAILVVTNFRHGGIYQGGKIHALLRRIALDKERS